jgi:hypothetical protein
MALSSCTEAPLVPSSPVLVAEPPMASTAAVTGDAWSVRCRRCQEPIVVAWAPVVSSHRWSQGHVSYVRCTCGGVGIAVTATTLARTA